MAMIRDALDRVEQRLKSGRGRVQGENGASTAQG